MKDWKIFKGNGKPNDEDEYDGISSLPAPPRWRQFGRRVENGKEDDKLEFVDARWSKDAEDKTNKRGASFRVSPSDTDLVDVVNAALYLRRPILITGKPGTGKTSLAYAVAYELKLGPILPWPITARSTLQEGLYRYDAIARLQDAQAESFKQNASKSSETQDEERDIGKYIKLGPIGTAFLPFKRPRVLLIDEVDKSDINLPNDLLNLFEEGEFEIPELARSSQTKVQVRTYDGGDAVIREGRVQCYEFPFVVLTSNGERDFPPAFLRRCLRLTLKDPGKEALTEIVKAHLGDELVQQAEPVITELIEKFIQRRKQGDLAADQLLNAVYLLAHKSTSEQDEKKDKLTNLLFEYLRM